MVDMVEPPEGTPGAGLEAVAGAWTRFAVDLYRRLAAREPAAARPEGAAPARPEGAGEAGNLVVSPSSVATVLAMILPGARGATATEIAAALHTRLDPGRGAGAAGALDAGLTRRALADELDLRISNAAWIQTGLEPLPEFLSTLVEAFRAGPRQVDFRADPEAARRAINALVAEQTAGKIPVLFDPGAIVPASRLVLTNAIYLQARWLEAFDPELTRPLPFHTAGGGTVEAPMLHRQSRFGYAEGDGWQAVELPYRGGRLVMDVILPGQGRFDSFMGELAAGWLDELPQALSQREVRLALPKFTFDSDLDLGQPLRALGVARAFSDSADFSGITGAEALRVDRVVQRAHVEVDERGTTAAAATGAAMRLVSMVVPSPPVELRFDRPFLFAVRDRTSGVPLFLGHVVDPLSR